MIKHLYDIFAEKWYCGGGTIYFIGDPHFGDLECYKFRFPKEFEFNGCESRPTDDWIVNKLDQMQIDNINRVCGKKDTLVLLGDIGNSKCVKKLKAGYKVLILGNHDRGLTYYKEATVSNRKITCPQCKGELHYSSIFGGEECRNCGAVYDIDYLIEKNKMFNEVYEGTLQIGPKIILSHEPVDYKYCLNIHGHCHSLNGMKNDATHLNVCAEWIDYKPQCLNKIVKNGYLKDVEDIHRETIEGAKKRNEKRRL